MLRIRKRIGLHLRIIAGVSISTNDDWCRRVLLNALEGRKLMSTA